MEQLEGHVLSMYAKGMRTRAISDFIREMYAMEISATEIPHIIESVIPAVNEWRSRQLEAVYPFVFLDCMHYKVRQNGTVESRAIYNILGTRMDGRKDLIGLYSSENEGVKYWLSVLTDLKQRGVEHIFIACIDGLTGFPEAIEAIFPITNTAKYPLAAKSWVNKWFNLATYSGYEGQVRKLIYTAIQLKVSTARYERLLNRA